MMRAPSGLNPAEAEKTGDADPDSPKSPAVSLCRSSPWALVPCVGSGSIRSRRLHSPMTGVRISCGGAL